MKLHFILRNVVWLGCGIRIDLAPFVVAMISKNPIRPVGNAKVELEPEALQLLEQARSEGESISEVIKRCVRPRQSAKDILRTMRQASISAQALRRIENSAARRRRKPHQSKS